MQLISLRDVLAHLETGEPCDLRFVTADKARKRGGRIIELNGCRLKQRLTMPTGSTKPSKPPRHYENATRNLVTQGGRIRKVHIRLITGFNGKKVIY